MPPSNLFTTLSSRLGPSTTLKKLGSHPSNSLSVDEMLGVNCGFGGFFFFFF
jgi:hypothetical protein